MSKLSLLSELHFNIENRKINMSLNPGLIAREAVGVAVKELGLWGFLNLGLNLTPAFLSA